MTLFRHPHGKPRYLSILVVLALATSLVRAPLSSAGEFALSKQILTKIEKQYGDYARRRLVSWRNLINDHQQLDDLGKLQKVNEFFNKLEFVNDIDLWGKEDYWATPLQMLASNGGDCEDFSIADQAHMVLTYFPTPDAVPLVLDNLVSEISSATDRQDLLPVYSFNGSGLWLAKARGVEKRVGRSERLSRWQEVIARIDEEQVPLSR
jgi:predicted transglutaminase-like cysteine proteinase